jgi:hypothetical protein
MRTATTAATAARFKPVLVTNIETGESVEYVTQTAAACGLRVSSATIRALDNSVSSPYFIVKRRRKLVQFLPREKPMDSKGSGAYSHLPMGPHINHGYSN